MMPSLLNIHTGSDDAGEHHATDFVLGDWLDGHTEPTSVFVGDWTHRLDCRITYKSSQVRGAKVRIAQWGVKTDDSTDRHSGRTLVVNANGGSVANVGTVSSAPRETIASDGISGCEQTVVFRRCNIDFFARSNAPCHYSIPNALKFASG